MGTQYRSSQRRGNQMARTNKTTNSNKSDDHLGREKTLREDSITQTSSHTNKVRAKKGLPPHQIVDPVIGLGSKDDTINNQILEDGGDAELVSNGGLIVGMRGYSGGVGAPVNSDEFVAIHRGIRRERARYRELNGGMVEVGKVLTRSDSTRKDKTRKVPGILKSIMVRLMPTEAEGIGEASMTRHDVEAAMDETVAAFEQATGCEVVTAVAHRMSVTDLHIHIQYTLVLPFNETSHMVGRRLKPWKLEAARKARESLRADGIEHPAPAQLGARKKKLITEGLIPTPPRAGIEYRKVAGERDLGDGAILGYSFRQKLNLVRAAELGGEIVLAEQVSRRNDERWGRFTPIAKRPDQELNDKYLDLWLERIWRRNITSQLPQDHRDRQVLAGVEAAKNYANYGTSIVEESHLKAKIKELEAEAEELQSRAEEVKIAKSETEKATKAAEDERRRLVIQLAAEKQPLNEKLAAQTAQIDMLQKEVRQSVETTSALQNQVQQIRLLLKPTPEEDLVKAARRVVAAVEKPAIEKIVERKIVKEVPIVPPETLLQLETTQKKVGELEEEITSLRRLAELVGKFLEAVMKRGPKLGAELLAMLQEMAEIIGKKFRPVEKKKVDQQPSME